MPATTTTRARCCSFPRRPQLQLSSASAAPAVAVAARARAQHVSGGGGISAANAGARRGSSLAGALCAMISANTWHCTCPAPAVTRSMYSSASRYTAGTAASRMAPGAITDYSSASASMTHRPRAPPHGEAPVASAFLDIVP
ncbi:hypothetical protein PVAP13_2KG363455 [Panicum virgatum]|uniref:Uncharacterized protein n=1 Tax=Panicum virgatum TaxID=38727 RepID=A0A8T0WGN8_PANVG|nr:hypothetical protein PVAP13_2KG363455 [Panicum virgatum]